MFNLCSVRMNTYVNDVGGWLCDRSPAAVCHQSIKRIEKEKDEEHSAVNRNSPRTKFDQIHGAVVLQVMDEERAALNSAQQATCTALKSCLFVPGASSLWKRTTMCWFENTNLNIRVIRDPR